MQPAGQKLTKLLSRKYLLLQFKYVNYEDFHPLAWLPEARPEAIRLVVTHVTFLNFT